MCYLVSLYEQFEDTKGVNRNCKSMYRQIQWPNEKDKETHTDLNNTIAKQTKD